MRHRHRLALLVLGIALLSSPLHAEDGSAAWLRYAPIPNPTRYANLPSHIVALGDSPSDRAAAAELARGLTSILGRPFTVESSGKSPEKRAAIVLGTSEAFQRVAIAGSTRQPVRGETYRITFAQSGGSTRLLIVGGTPAAEVYGAFHLLEEIGAQKPIPANDGQSPSAPVRWVDEWDNLDGSIERGYAGRSIFFDNGHVRQDLTRAGQYARLLASIGINGRNVNNVIVPIWARSPREHLRVSLLRIADAFRPWGV